MDDDERNSDVRFNDSIIFVDGVAVAQFIPPEKAGPSLNREMQDKFRRFIVLHSTALIPTLPMNESG